jgi:hypothetical protein
MTLNVAEIFASIKVALSLKLLLSQTKELLKL